MRNDEPQTRASLRAARQQQEKQGQASEPDFDTDPLGEPLHRSRREQRHQETETGTEFKTNRLKRRLNWAILIVGILIVLVYLVLFFV